MDYLKSIDPTAWCVLVGAIISFIVSALKNVAFVRDNAKKVAALLAAVGGLVVSMLAAHETTFLHVLLCFIEQLALAIGTYEVVTKPMASAAKGDDTLRRDGR